MGQCDAPIQWRARIEYESSIDDPRVAVMILYMILIYDVCIQDPDSGIVFSFCIFVCLMFGRVWLAC